jgi:hypothetical protein
MDEINLKDKNLFKVRQPGSEVEFNKVDTTKEKGIRTYKNYYDKEKLDIKSVPNKGPKDYEATKVELPENIQAFDKKAKNYTENPYSYNSVAFKEKESTIPSSQTADQLITNPVYNLIGKFLGVDTVNDWGRYYDKVYAITEWAKGEVGDDVQEIMKFLDHKARTLPSVGNKTIDNLHIFAKLNKK